MHWLQIYFCLFNKLLRGICTAIIFLLKKVGRIFLSQGDIGVPLRDARHYTQAIEHNNLYLNSFQNAQYRIGVFIKYGVG